MTLAWYGQLKMKIFEGKSLWIVILMSWGIAMVLWMWVLNRLEVGQVSTSIYLLPLFGLILSIITVHDRITLSQILGGSLTVAGTATLTLFEGKRSASSTAESTPN